MATTIIEETKTSNTRLSLEESIERFPVLPKGMSVAMAVPQGFETHEQYREYLSWRTEIQILVTQIVDWQRSNSQEDKKQWLTRMKRTIRDIRKRAEKFPPQPIMEDLKVMCYSVKDTDSPALSAKSQEGMEYFNVKKLMRCIHSLIGNVTTLSVDTLKIKNTVDLSEELVKVIS